MKKWFSKRTLSLNLCLGAILSMFCFQLYAKENVGKECKDLQSFLSTSSFKIDCNPHFHHYNSKAIKYYNKSDAIRNGLKVASFNLLYPGNSRNRYKDYGILAKMMNQWDIVGAQELVPSQGEEFHHNQMLMTSRASSAKLIREHYKIPGFLIILNELRKLDPSWALLISSKAEAAKKEYSKELGGFFYRASTIKPIDNDFCGYNYDIEDGPSLGCLADFTTETIGKEANSIFSRRPFMASFQSGNFDFTALTSHVVYTSPSDPATRERIVKKAFGISNYKKLGKGATAETYARFAEIKITLQFMEYLWDYYDEEDIILLGDFNVENKNPFWKKIKDEFDEAAILNDSPTTLTDQKYKFLKGEEVITNGVSRNYDHIVLNRENTKECSGQAKVFNFLENNKIGREIKKKYIVRSSVKRGSSYPISAANEKRMNGLIKKYKKTLENKLTIKRNKVVKDTKDIKRYVSGYKKRVFQSQKRDRSFYHLYKEIISDHLPVYISCDTSGSDDD